MDTNKKLARAAGFLFLILIAGGVFAEFFVRQQIIVAGDSVSTANNIRDHEWLFRIGIVSDLVMATAFLLFTLLMYRLLKKVNIHHAQLMLLCVVISVAIMCVNTLNQVAAFQLVNGEEYLNAFTKDQLQSLATFFLRMHSNGYIVAQLFFGLYLFPLGYLVFKSGFLPKIIGVLLMVGCVGDLIAFLNYFLIPGNDSVILQNISLPADIGEISFCLWLVVKGVKDPSTVKMAEIDQLS